MSALPDPVATSNFDKIQLEGARRHAFLCLGPDCCSADVGEAAWAELKSQLKHSGAPVLRTKAACLRICSGGPWMVVYPEGTWYGNVTAERCGRIVREHLEGGNPVEAWIARRHPLASGL